MDSDLHSEATLTPPAIRPAARAWSAWRDWPRPERLRTAGAALYAAMLTVLFVEPLSSLTVYALGNSLHSHIPLVPFVSGYLLLVEPRRIARLRSSIPGAAVAALAGGAALAAAALWHGRVSVNDGLALTAFAYVSLMVAGGFLFLGSAWVAAHAFPLAFLLFIVPLPDRAADWLARASVLASADVSARLFEMTGTPLLRSGTVFALPGIVLEIAQECSGIRSSWVLFITSVLAAHVFLRTTWRRAALVAFAVPLAIVRNAVRILVIGLLCVHVGPEMIDSPIHRHGGPLFFAASLAPLFLWMLWLYRGEQRRGAARLNGR